MMRTSLLAVPFALVTLAAAACVEEESTLGVDTAGLGVVNGNGDPCPKLGCGSNSAHVGPAEFHELDETGVTANNEGLRITGFQQHEYAPRDFTVLCDDKVVATVKDAQYGNNVLIVDLPPTRCTVVQLDITGSHGPSPAIRELELLPAP